MYLWKLVTRSTNYVVVAFMGVNNIAIWATVSGMRGFFIIKIAVFCKMNWKMNSFKLVHLADSPPPPPHTQLYYRKMVTNRNAAPTINKDKEETWTDEKQTQNCKTVCKALQNSGLFNNRRNC